MHPSIKERGGLVYASRFCPESRTYIFFGLLIKKKQILCGFIRKNGESIDLKIHWHILVLHIGIVGTRAQDFYRKRYLTRKFS